MHRSSLLHFSSFEIMLCNIHTQPHMHQNTATVVGRNLGPIFLNAVYFRRGLMSTLGLTNDLIDGGQLRAKPHLCKANQNHVLKTVFSPRLATVYQLVG